MPPPFAYGSRTPAQPIMEWRSIFPRSPDATEESRPTPASPLPDNRKRKMSPWSSSEPAIVAEERADSLRALRSDALVRLRRVSASLNDAFTKQGLGGTTTRTPSTSEVDRASHNPVHDQSPARDVAQLWADNEILRAQLQSSQAEVRIYEARMRDLTSRVVNAEADAVHAGLLSQNALRAANAAIEQAKTAKIEAEEAERHASNLEHELADAQIDAQTAEQRAERAEERAADAERRVVEAEERCAAAEALVAACRAEHRDREESADGDTAALITLNPHVDVKPEIDVKPAVK